MLRLLVLSALVVASISGPVMHFNTELDDEWSLYKNAYGKQYEQEEELMRYELSFLSHFLSL